MSVESAISFFLAILIFGVTPGPSVFAIMARALVKGTRACFMLALGMTISDILYLIAACYGLAAIAAVQRLNRSAGSIMVAAGAYLASRS